jgi:predicted Ser/Thr protein kinase
MRASERRPLSLPPSIPAAGSRDDHDDPMIGQVLLGRVKIVRAIARGGMGKVYYAEQVAMGRPCAVKVLDPRMAGASREEFTRRFLLEASVAAKLTHPNVVTIYDYGETDDGSCFIAMEYLEGETLSETLKREKRLSPERAVGVARQVCRALREAHAIGVVHRDMKPGNIFLVRHDDEGDFVKVLDFGLVKETHSGGDDDAHTQVGQIMGSPRYMAPEQIEGKAVDGRTDIYALGTVMYAMLSGHPPFERANEMATMMAHVAEPVVPLAQLAPDVLLPPGLEAVVMHCLEKDPARRFSSMEEMLAALKLEPGAGLLAIDSGQHAFASPALLYGPASMAPPEPPPQSNTSRLLAVVLVAAAACGAILYITNMRAPAAAVAPPVAASVAPPLPVGSTPPRAPDPVATVVVHFDSDPQGARVKEDDAIVCESTPCDIQYKGPAADPTIEHLYVVTKRGFEVEKKLAKVWASPITVKLSKGR